MQTAKDFLTLPFLGCALKVHIAKRHLHLRESGSVKNMFVDDITNYNLIMINLFVLKVFGAPSHQSGRVHQVALSQVGLVVEIIEMLTKSLI